MRDVLAEELQRLRALPFPEGSSDDVADELHAELVGLDGHIAGKLARSVGAPRGAPPFITAEDVHTADDLRYRLEQLAAEGTPVARTAAARYLAYLSELRRAMAVARGEARG